MPRGRPTKLCPFSVLTREELSRKENNEGKIDTGFYAAGWIRRGPTGVIGTNKADGELVADLTVYFSKLKGIEVPISRVPSMIDEYPILSIIASFATGKTIMRGIKELTVKESNRILSMAKGLKQCGIEIEYGDDFLIVSGQKKVTGGAKITTFGHHRVAMSFLCLGQASEKPIILDEYSSINTSFPTSINEFRKVGANTIQN